MCLAFPQVCPLVPLEKYPNVLLQLSFLIQFTILCIGSIQITVFMVSFRFLLSVPFLLSALFLNFKGPFERLSFLGLNSNCLIVIDFVLIFESYYLLDYKPDHYEIHIYRFTFIAARSRRMNYGHRWRFQIFLNL